MGTKLRDILEFRIRRMWRLPSHGNNSGISWGELMSDWTKCNSRWPRLLSWETMQNMHWKESRSAAQRSHAEVGGFRVLGTQKTSEWPISWAVECTGLDPKRKYPYIWESALGRKGRPLECLTLAM